MANYIRCIQFSKGTKEGVLFTRELYEDAIEFIPLGFTVVSDTEEIREGELPSSFPFEDILWKD